MLLDVEDVHVYYGKSHVIDDVSLSVEANTCLGLVGRNGVGKTTLISAVMGMLAVKGGRVLLDGRQIHGKKPRAIAKAGVGIVPQGRHVFRSLSVVDNLVVSHISRGQWTPERAMELFPKLKTMKRRRARNLSGGEQQMLAIGRALVTNPTLLLMDEPSEGLAPAIVKTVAEAVADIKKEGITLLLAEQNLPMVCKVADSIVVMSTGHVVWRGLPDELLADEDCKATHLGFSKVA